VAFVVHGDQAVVYVCDGKRRGEWFGGPVVDGRINLESDDGTRVVGSVTPRRVSGTISTPGGPKLKYVAVPTQDRPGTGLYVFDDPGKKGYKARWIVTRYAVHGVSTTTTGSVTNGVTVKAPTTSTGSTTDSRFSSVSPEVTRLLSQQQQLQAELKAATSENVSLRETLSGTSTTTTGTTTTKTP
jgi:hypothetical protein